jgi:transcriptional antiterminator RfaH
MKIARLGRSGDGFVALKLHNRRTGMGLVWPAFDSPAAGCESSSAERRWFAVRTKARREQYAVEQLERRGVAIFFPRVLEVGRAHVAPLFPGYLFVHIALLAQYYRVIWTPGVRGFVAFGPTPAPVPEAVIGLMRASAGPGDVIRQRPRLGPGDRVAITGGPLAGLMAVIERPCSERGRVRILLDFLRQGASVELPVALIDRV